MYTYNQPHTHTSRMVIFASWLHGLRRGSATDRLLGLRVRILLRVWMFFPGAKRSGTEADHTPRTSAKVKNEWNFTSPSFMCLHGVDGENISCTLPTQKLHCCYMLAPEE